MDNVQKIIETLAKHEKSKIECSQELETLIIETAPETVEDLLVVIHAVVTKYVDDSSKFIIVQGRTKHLSHVWRSFLQVLATKLVFDNSNNIVIKFTAVDHITITCIDRSDVTLAYTEYGLQVVLK